VSIEYLRGFRELRRDPAWMRKVGLASLLLISSMMVPLLGQLAFVGWTALIMRRAIAGNENGELPRIDFDFGWLGKLVGIGFKPFLVGFLWQLPAVFLGVAVGLCGAFAPILILGASGGRGGQGGGEAGVLVMIVFAAMWLLLVPLSILLRLPATIAVLRVEVTDDMQQGMKFKEVLDMLKVVWKELLIGTLVLSLVSVPLVLGGMLCCYVGIFPAAVVISVVTSHFLAQLYPLYLERGGTPLVVAPPDPIG
jgi:Protein of unknown function (DUF4013)